MLFDTDRPAWKLVIYRQLLFLFQYTRCGFVCVSKYEVRALRELGFSTSKLHLVYNGTNAEAFYYAPKNYEVEKPLKLLFVGRLAVQKGLPYLIDAVKDIPNNQVQLSIVGDGELAEELQTKVLKNNAKHIQFLGFVKDVRALIAQHHVLVVPSLWEVFGISISEGMAMGKAIIATRVGGIPELIQDGKGGYLCPPADAAALQKAIIKLEEKPQNITAFGAFNREYFETNFSFERTIEGFKKLYR